MFKNISILFLVSSIFLSINLQASESSWFRRHLGSAAGSLRYGQKTVLSLSERLSGGFNASKQFSKRLFRAGKSLRNVPVEYISCVAFAMLLSQNIVMASEVESENDEEYELVGGLWSLTVATVVAREFLEAIFIIYSYLNLSDKAIENDLDIKEPDSKFFKWRGYKAQILQGASLGVAGGFALMTSIGLALHYTAKEFNETYFEFFEGISKILAAFAVGAIYLDIKHFIGQDISKEKIVSMLSNTRLHVAWNIFREMAEIIAILIPAFLANDLSAEAAMVSISGGMGIGIASGGALIYAQNHFDWDIEKVLRVITYWLSTGLFMNGVHELEEVFGETDDFIKFIPEWMSQKEFPFVLFRVIGYTDKYSYLEAASWSGIQLFFHFHEKIKDCANSLRLHLRGFYNYARGHGEEVDV